MGPTIGSSIAIPHIKAVPVIRGFGEIIGSIILRHLPLSIAHAVGGEEFWVWFVDDIPATGRKVVFG